MSTFLLIQWVGAFGIAALMIAVSILWQTLFPAAEDAPTVRSLGIRFAGYFLLLCMLSLFISFRSELGLSLPALSAAMFLMLAAASVVFDPALHRSENVLIPRIGFIAVFTFLGIYLLSFWPW
jgi:hypothetical protein